MLRTRNFEVNRRIGGNFDSADPSQRKGLERNRAGGLEGATKREERNDARRVNRNTDVKNERKSPHLDACDGTGEKLKINWETPRRKR